MKPAFPLYLFACTLLAGCTATSQSPEGSDHTWLVHCETDKSYTLDVAAVPGIYDGRWLWAEHAPGEEIHLRGSLKSGFFHLQSAVSGAGKALPVGEKALRQFCIDTIARDEPRDLVRVLAARDSRDIDIPIIYPGEDKDPDKVTRLVVLGDSLSDAGLIAFIKDEGRFFVSGSLAEQVTEFLEDSSLPRQVSDPGKTAFLIWAGRPSCCRTNPTPPVQAFIPIPAGE